MRTTVSTKGQIVLPAEFRRRDGIRPGQEFEVERLGADEYRLTRVAATNEGLVGWLLACPQKGYFVGIDSESTDTL
jgi:AbrB family looped-hinge helix DNA binding protein